jgi:hypothetical protein
MRVILTIMSPFILTVMLWITIGIKRQLTQKDKRTLFVEMVRAAALVFFFLHPTVTETILQHYDTVTIDGVQRLRIDLDVVVGDAVHQAVAPVVGIAAMVIMVGIPVGYCLLMMWARSDYRIQKNRDRLATQNKSNVAGGERRGTTTVIKRDKEGKEYYNHVRGYLLMPGGWVYETLGATFAHYTPNKKAAQYWEAIRITRKAILITTSVFIHDALTQGYVGLFILVCCAVLCAWTKPFRFQARKYNGLELSSLAVLCATAALGKIDELEQSYLGGTDTIKCENPTAASILIVLLNSILAVVLVGSLALETYRRVWGTTVEQLVAWNNWERFTNKMLVRSTFRGHMKSFVAPSRDVRISCSSDPFSLSIDLEAVPVLPPGGFNATQKTVKPKLDHIDREGVEMGLMTTSQNPLNNPDDDGWTHPQKGRELEIPGDVPNISDLPSAPMLTGPPVTKSLRQSIMQDRKSEQSYGHSDGVAAAPAYYRYYDEGYKVHYFIDRDTGESTWDAPPDHLWSDAPPVGEAHLLEC